MKSPIILLFQKSRYLGVALLCAIGSTTHAGTMLDDGKTIVDAKDTPVAEPSDPWRFSMGIPGWLAATSGTIGLNGINSHVYMGFDTLVKHLDMTASLSAEVRKGRFGVYGDMLYVKASDSVYSDGLIGKAAVRLDQWLADLEVNYRVLEGPKGYLDLRAGVRYTDMYSKLVTNANNEAINQASTDLVNDVADKVKEKLSSLNLKSLLATALEDRIKARITDKLGGVGPNDAPLAIPPLGGGQHSVADQVVQTVVDKHLVELQADLQAQIAAATAALKAAAQAKIDSLKARIASEIAASLKSKLNASASLNERWLDPYVGFAFRYNLAKAWYLTGKADIGGFGVGSEITWQGYGALGCQVSHWCTVEAGYRYLYTDYNQGGFLYDVTQSGAQLNVGITF